VSGSTVITPARLACTILPLMAALTPPIVAAHGQEQQAPAPSRTEAPQIDPSQINALPTDRRSAPSKVFLEPRNTAPTQPRPSLMQAAGDQISGPSGSTPTSQISARSQSGAGVAQLSKADLEATLAQLSPAERLVLLQAIEGSDICDNPPRIAAVIALCQNRLENRSGEFAAMIPAEQSAEDRLLRGDADHARLPNVSQVIDRLARSSAAADDFSNQAIASIALATPATTPSQPTEEQLGTGGLAEETQALVNAIINQLGGRAP
jgi:hypothetical protein